jgi:hypothetical protein
VITLFALLFGMWAFFRYRGKTITMLHTILGMVILTYCFLVLFGLNRDRYLIPILLIVPFGLALAIHRLAVFLSWRVSAIAVASLLLLNCLANFSDTKPRYPDYQGLAQFLESKGLFFGYAHYTAAYPLVYLSSERLIYTPVFHEPQYDRYTAHAAIVSDASNPAFVFDKEEDTVLFKQKVKQVKASFKKEVWRRFTVYHQLNPKLQIGDLR